MIRRTLMLILITACCLCSCRPGSVESQSGSAGTEAVSDKEEPEEETGTETAVTEDTEKTGKEENQKDVADVDASNQKMIAQALGVEEDDRCLPFLVAALRVIDAGQITGAEAGEKDGEKVLHVTAEDGTGYDFYLSKENSLNCVINSETGESVMASER